MATPLEKTLYIGPFIHSESLTTLDVCPNGMIGVDTTGKIAFISRDVKGTQLPPQSGWEDARIVRIAGVGFFFPGFIDTHTHASQYPNAGIFGKSTLLDWLNTYTFPLEASFSDLQKAASVYGRVVARTLSHGTTTACYYATRHVAATNLLADVCLSKGQRAFVGRVCMDQLSPEYYRDESAEESVKGTKECIEHVRKIDPGFALVCPIVTPRFAPSCSWESMCGLGKLWKEEGVPVQTHISENVKECELVGEMFPSCGSYVEVYDETGLLGDRTILAHAIHLSKEERDLVKKREAKVSHCPASNTALTSGRCPVKTLLNEGITVGLGTDVSGGYTPSILAEAREALFTSRHLAMEVGHDAKLSVEEALYLATVGGAKVVGLEREIGRFEVGMDWDAQMVELATVGDTIGIDQNAGLVEIFGWETWEDKVAKWVYTGDDRNTTAVWVKGKLVHWREGFKP